MRTDKKRLSVPDDFFDGPSKSQLKRDAIKLQELGVRLASLRPKQLATLDLNEVLLKAIEDYNLLPNSNSALKRHAQFIGKRMRDQDYETLLAAVEALENPRTTTRPGTTPPKALSATAQACEELTADASDTEEVITKLVEQHPRLERQKLRQLVRNHFVAVRKADADADATKRTRTKLMQYLGQNFT
jgi:ribosome-associated protein